MPNRLVPQTIANKRSKTSICINFKNGLKRVDCYGETPQNTFTIGFYPLKLGESVGTSMV